MIGGRVVALLFATATAAAAWGGLSTPAASQPVDSASSADSASSREDAAPWLQAAPFSLDPAELLRAGRAATSRLPDAPVVIVSEDVTLRIAADGRVERRRYRLYTVRDPTALLPSPAAEPVSATSAWRGDPVGCTGLCGDAGSTGPVSGAFGSSRVPWDPAHQEQPSLRVRVIDAAGTEQRLAPDAVGSRVLDPLEPRGARVLVARLPVAPGAWVEEEVVLRDLHSRFGPDIAGSWRFPTTVPLLDLRLRLEAPTTLALRYGVRRLEGHRARTEVENDVVRVTVEASLAGRLPRIEPSAPPWRPQVPQVAFSTGRDWAAVARRAAGRSLPERPGGEIDGLAGSLRREASADPSSALWAAVRAVHQRLRLVVSSGTGAASLSTVSMARGSGVAEVLRPPTVPVDADAILRRGTATPREVAEVASAVLARLGWRAHLVFVDGGPGSDLEPRLPGLGPFDRVLLEIVPRAPNATGDVEPVWIDPADPFARPGELPLDVQGRWALRLDVEAPPDRPLDLVRTPAAAPEDHRIESTRRVRLVEWGPGSVEETTTFHGAAARAQRALTSGLTEDDRRRLFRAYVADVYDADRLGSLEEGSLQPADASNAGPSGAAASLTSPERAFVLRLDAVDAGIARTDLESARVTLDAGAVTRRLPPLFDEPLGERSEELWFEEPFVTRWSWRIEPPLGFRAVEPERASATRDLPLGPGRFRQEITRSERGGLRVDLELDVGQRLLSVAQLEAMHAGVRALRELPPLELRFVAVGGDDLDGAAPAALSAALTAVAEMPESASHRVRLAELLTRLGLAEAAVRQAREAVVLEPTWAPAHRSLGRASLLGRVGVPWDAGADLDTARAAFDEAARLAPDDATLALETLRARAFGEGGGRQASAGDEAAAADRGLAARAALAPSAERDAFDRELALLLLSLDRDTDARTLAADSTDEATRRAVAYLDASGSGDSGPRDAAAARLLTNARRYREAARAWRAAGDGAQAAWVGSARRHEAAEALPDDPTTAVRGFLVDSVRRGATRREVSRWLHPRALRRLDDGGLIGLRRVLLGLAPRGAGWAGIDPIARADLALAAFEDPSRVTLAGAPHLGYRVTVGAGDGDASGGSIYLTPLGPTLRIVASGFDLDEMALEVLERVVEGDLRGAARWLDWLQAEWTEHGDLEAPFLELWPPPDAATRAAWIGPAAAVAAASIDRSGRVDELLSRALDGVTLAQGPGAVPDRREALLIARARAARELGSLDRAASRLDEAGRVASDPATFRLRFDIALDRGDVTSAARLAAEREATLADALAARASAEAALAGERFADAALSYRRLESRGGLRALDAERWARTLFAASQPPERVAAQIDGWIERFGPRPELLRAASAARAATGDVPEAREHFERARESARPSVPSAGDLWVVSRLAAAAGLDQTADELEVAARAAVDPDSRFGWGLLFR